MKKEKKRVLMPGLTKVSITKNGIEKDKIY